MNENEIKQALDGIEPEEGAQERMYANILKKAADQEKKQAIAAGAVSKHRPISVLRRWGSLAACLAIVAAICFTLPELLHNSGQNPLPEMTGSPIEDVSGAQDFEKLGFSIDAPEGSEHISYHILNGETAQVIFAMDGREYTYRAARLDEDFSGVYGEAISSVTLNTECIAVLDHLSPDIWRAHWSRDGINFYLTCVNGADEETVTATVNALQKKN